MEGAQHSTGQKPKPPKQQCREPSRDSEGCEAISGGGERPHQLPRTTPQLLASSTPPEKIQVSTGHFAAAGPVLGDKRIPKSQPQGSQLH